MTKIKEANALLSLPTTIEALWECENYLDELADQDEKAMRLLTLVQNALRELGE